MKKPILSILLFALVISSPFRPIAAETLRVKETPTGTGWLERTDQGDLVLHLAGSWHDIGVQEAALLQDEARIAIRSAKFSVWINAPYVPVSLALKQIYKQVAQFQAANYPESFREEMEAIATESGVSLELIQTLHATTYLTSCETAAAWGPATADGALLFARSNDVAIAIDPATGRSYHEMGGIVIYQPIDGVPFLMFSWPGFIGASDGMNAEGIAIGNMSLPSKHETPNGIPMPFRVKQALARARALDEAVEWITQKPLEGGYNFIVADAKIPAAVAVEMDAQTVYVGGWDGPAESNSYDFLGRHYQYTPVEGLVMRANHPLSDELIAHRERPMDDGTPHSPLSYQRYVDLRARLLGAYGRLDLDSVYELLRESYRAVDWEKGPTLGGSSHQLAFSPKTGDFRIAWCQGNPLVKGRRAVSAFNQPVRRYNFFELLKRKPDVRD